MSGFTSFGFNCFRSVTVTVNIISICGQVTETVSEVQGA